jgi:hypothetical protein
MRRTSAGTAQIQIAPPIAPQKLAAAPAVLGFDFVQLHEIVSAKDLPKLPQKKWRLKASGPQGLQLTRKKFSWGKIGELAKGPFIRVHSSKAWLDRAHPAVNALTMEFEGPKLSAARTAIATGQVQDTGAFRGHVEVLATAQRKLALKMPMERAAQKLSAAKDALKQYEAKLNKLQAQGVAEAQHRNQEIMVTRADYLSTRGVPCTPTKERFLAKGKTLANNLVRKFTIAAEAPAETPGGDLAQILAERGQKALQKAKAKALPRFTGANTPRTNPKVAERTEKLLAAAAPAKELIVDREALLKHVLTRARARHEKPQAYIEFLLLETAAAAYLPDVVYDALLALHTEYSVKAGESFVKKAQALLQEEVNEVNQLERQYQEAKQAYDALPMPG